MPPPLSLNQPIERQKDEVEQDRNDATEQSHRRGIDHPTQLV
jgi:hypothetical protein